MSFLRKDFFPLIVNSDDASQWFERFESLNFVDSFELSDKEKIKTVLNNQLSKIGKDLSVLDPFGFSTKEEMSIRLDAAINEAIFSHAQTLVSLMSDEILSVHEINSYQDKISKILAFSDKTYIDLMAGINKEDSVSFDSEEKAREAYNDIVQEAYYSAALNIFSIIEQRPNFYDYNPARMGFNRTIRDDIAQINMGVEKSGKTLADLVQIAGATDLDVETRIEQGRKSVMVAMARSIYKYLLKAQVPSAMGDAFVSKTLKDSISKYFDPLQKEIEIQLDRAGAEYKDLDVEGKMSNRQVKDSLRRAKCAMHTRVVRNQRAKFRSGQRF
tara:strand:- start:938 stop:1924 length:987 start_codon:yes stop_codon:yes gene_type:complete